MAKSQRWSRHEMQRIKMNDLFENWNQQLDRETGGRGGGGPGVEAGTSC
jgi:hypothetical protein